MSAEKRQIDLDYAYTLRRVNTNLCNRRTLFCRFRQLRQLIWGTRRTAGIGMHEGLLEPSTASPMWQCEACGSGAQEATEAPGWTDAIMLEKDSAVG